MLLQFYSNSVDMVSSTHNQRLLLVRNKIQDRFYKYSDYFGVDVWNVSTRKKFVVLSPSSATQLLCSPTRSTAVPPLLLPIFPYS